jgi:hypothetical protein
MRWFWNPWLLLRRNTGALKNHLRALYFYLRNRKRQVAGDGYALVVDEAHDYRLLTCYMDCAHQRRQLEHVGFTEIEVIAADGQAVKPDSRPRDPWIHYVAHKPA